jgi:nucleoid DNA-binding protein
VSVGKPGTVHYAGSVKREELARTLSRQTRLSRAAARDQVDELVHRILKTLRKGQAVELPGVGKLVAKAASRRGPR